MGWLFSRSSPRARYALAVLLVLLLPPTVSAQEPADARLNRAISAYLAGDLMAASAALDSVPADVSRSDRALTSLYRGLIAFTRNDIEQARLEFGRALEEQPSLRLDAGLHSPSRIALFDEVRGVLVAQWRQAAESAESRGDRSEALANWSAVLGADPGDDEAREAIGRLASGDPPPRPPPAAAEPEREESRPSPASPRERTVGALSPTTAMLLGMAVPGGGEFYARRPVRGALVLGGTAAALAAGFMITRIEVDCRSVPEEGVCPPDDLLGETETRPYLVPAVAVAALITLAGAVDAALGVRGDAASAGLSSRIRTATGGGVDVTLLRFRR